MIRAGLFSIVLAMSLGQSVQLVCSAWCDPGVVETNGCHDGSTPGPALAADGPCTDGVLGGDGFIKEEMPRRVAASHTGHAIAVPRDPFAAALASARGDHQPGRARSLDHRPLATALRI